MITWRIVDTLSVVRAIAFAKPKWEKNFHFTLGIAPHDVKLRLMQQHSPFEWNNELAGNLMRSFDSWNCTFDVPVVYNVQCTWLCEAAVKTVESQRDKRKMKVKVLCSRAQTLDIVTNDSWVVAVSFRLIYCCAAADSTLMRWEPIWMETWLHSSWTRVLDTMKWIIKRPWLQQTAVWNDPESEGERGRLEIDNYHFNFREIIVSNVCFYLAAPQSVSSSSFIQNPHHGLKCGYWQKFRGFLIVENPNFSGSVDSLANSANRVQQTPTCGAIRHTSIKQAIDLSKCFLRDNNLRKPNVCLWFFESKITPNTHGVLVQIIEIIVVARRAISVVTCAAAAVAEICVERSDDETKTNRIFVATMNN